jgi:hypothetical protein
MIKLKNLLLLLIGLLFVSCSFSKNKQQNKNSDTLNHKSTVSLVPLREQIADTVVKKGLYFIKNEAIIPTFYVKINLSYKAKQKILELEKTIMVSFAITFYYDKFTDPKNSVFKKYPPVHDGADAFQLFQDINIDIKNNELAKFENFNFDRKVYDLLIDKNITVYLSVDLLDGIYMLQNSSMEFNLSELTENKIFIMNVGLLDTEKDIEY